MRRSFIFLVLFVLVSSCTANRNNKVDGARNESLELSLRFDRSEYHSGDPVIAIVTLKNIGEEILIVNSRMAMDLPYRSSPFREIAFRIKTPVGESYWPSVKINNGYIENDDFIELHPGESIEKSYNLMSVSYEFSEPGIYVVIANYQNIVDPSAIDLTDSRIAWKGEINSGEVLLAIVP